MARRFTGTDRVAVGTRPIPAVGTLALWWYPEFAQTDGINHSAFYVENSANTFFYLQKHASGFSNRLAAGWQNGGVDYRVTTTTYTLNQNAWNSLILTWDGSGTNLFLNSTLVASGVAPVTFTSTATRYIGNNPVFGNPAQGRIAEVVICDRVWSAQERAAFDAGMLPRRIGAVDGYWPLWGGDTSEQDLSSNGNTGTVTGTTRANHAPVDPAARRWWGSDVVEGAPPPSVQLTGSVAGSSSGAGALQVTRRLSGSLSGLAVVSAAPRISRRLVVSSAGSGLATGAPSVSRRLSGSSAGLGSVVGACGISRRLAATSDGAGSANGALWLSRSLSGASAGGSAIAATPQISRRFQGATGGASVLSAALQIRRLLLGLAEGVGSLAGYFFQPPVELSGTVGGTATASGALRITRSLRGNSSATGTLTGALLLRRLLRGTAAGVGQSSGTLTLTNATGPICYGGAVRIRTAYGGSCTIRVRYGGSVDIRVRYGGSAEICGDE